MRRPRYPVLVLLACVIALPAAQAPDRTKPPQAGPAPMLKLPAIQKRQLSNGLPVWIVERHQVPVVQVNLVVLRGSSADPGGQFGLTSLTTAMLEEGAGSRSALQIADAIDFLGADLGTASTFDASAVRLHVPVTRLSEALPIMADVALRPTFPQDELERLRQQRLTSILQARDDPASIAAQAFPRVLFGPTHRYGTPTQGTAQAIKDFRPADLRSQYARLFRPGNSTLIVVGDVKPEDALPLLESSFGSWHVPDTAPALPLPTGDQPARRAVYLVDKPGAAQSQIRIGWIGVARSTADYFPIQVMNTILGGSFTSRLNMNLRENHGYAYGASSSFDMRGSAGPFAAGAGVQTDKTSESLTEFFNELNGILKAVPADELARARNYVALRFPSAFESTSDIARRLEDMLIFRLPEDYFATYIPNIEGVTSADIQRVAQKYIQPSRFAVVVVGDRKVIEPGIRALNLGTIKPLGIDDIFGPAPIVGK